ncbi:MAG TPA: protein kinase family protein [Streptosporangiaceae bacterium]|nr:protein kinase family protein [Streptosporangiaceae bacterium]
MSTFTSEPGTRLGGRYRLEDRVAAASGWAAWKAIDETLARAVTVVTFAAGFPRVREVLTAARAASRLTDARLAQVFDVEDDWDNAYIVMEWAAGETLDDLLANGPIDPVAGARIIAEAAAALSVAHAAGLPHLCLTPESLRWTSGGGVKVTGIGVDAALSGTTAEDPALADTHGLGRLLYAAMTGLWPGPDYPALPSAPFADGQPRRPRQIRAGVPAMLDDVTCRAMQMPGRAGPALETPGQLAGALAAELPPEEVPPARPPDAAPRSMARPRQQQANGNWSAERAPAGPPQDWRPPPRRAGSRARVAVITVLALVVVVGLGAATYPFWHKTPAPVQAQSRHSSSPPPAAQFTRLTPASAQGFDALNLADSGDENTSQAENVLNGNAQGWSSQEYATAQLGNLKAGTGLILDMGHVIKMHSITVKFGSAAGADVQVKMGNSATRSAANLNSMATVASANNVGGTYTFTTSGQATGQYVVIWFTKMPLASGGHYTAQIFTIIVQGAVAPS